jgi:hypothetical protein
LMDDDFFILAFVLFLVVCSFTLGALGVAIVLEMLGVVDIFES